MTTNTRGARPNRHLLFLCQRDRRDAQSIRSMVCLEFNTMRLPIIPPAELSTEQKPLYDDMRGGIAKNFQSFVNIRDDGALLGPWNPWIHEPKFGKPVWDITKAMVSNPSLPAPVREVAIPCLRYPL